MMTVDDFNAFCRALPHTTHVVQWGRAQVWKIGGKVFAIGGWNDTDEELFVTFKCSELAYEMLREMPGCRPAPYLASRGMKWIQRTSDESMIDSELREHITASYRMIADALPRRVRAELGLQSNPSAKSSKLPRGRK